MSRGHRYPTLSRNLALLVCGICAVAVALMAGCVTKRPTLHREIAPLPMATATIRENQIVPPQPIKPMFLMWDNPNDHGISSFMMLEIWGTTNLTKPFKLWGYASAQTNAIAFLPTNVAQFFIARFAITNQTPWEYSDWNTK